MIRALIAGVLLAAGAAPHDHWYFAIAGMALLYALLQRRGWKRRLLAGFTCFFPMFLITLTWSQQFTKPGWVALSLAEAAFFAAAVAFVPRTRDARSALAFVAAVTLAEMVRTHVPFGGLPLGSFTTGAVGSPLAPLVSVFGEAGLVAFMASVAVGLRELFRHPKRVALPAAVATVAAISVGSIDYTTRTEPIAVATVQAGGPQGLERAEQRPDRVFDGHVAATANVAAGTRIVVWPEDVVTVHRPIDETAEGAELARLAIEHNAYLGAGVVEVDRSAGRFRNAFVVWSPQGEIESRYEKRQRVPFGEYVPARNFFDRLGDLSQVPYDAIPGQGTSVVEFGDDKAATAISYEGLFSRLVADGVRDGGDFVVIPTNAASYENPNVALTQVRGARMRAKETQRSVVQAAPTGISVIVDRDGDTLARSSVGKAEVLSATIPSATGLTPYVRWGDWPLAILAAGLAIAAATAERRSSKKV